MLEKSVAVAQSSKPSQMATEWAGPGQAARPQNYYYFLKKTIHTSKIFNLFALHSLRCGEWTTGSEWAGLLRVDSSPFILPAVAEL